MLWSVRRTVYTGRERRVVLYPRAQVFQRALLVELVHVRDAEREQRVEVVRVVLDRALEARDGLAVLVLLLVRGAQPAPRVA